MLFHSLEFIFLFFPIVLIGYFVLNARKNTSYGLLWLSLSSLFFYGWWNPTYVWLILFSMAVNFCIGKHLVARCRKAWCVGIGVAFNLLLLGYFKYMDFFIENYNFVFRTEHALWHLVLPLGISFFSFTQIAYLVETYKDKVSRQDALSYMLFVSYFPHLLAGPIIHYEQMMPQFLDEKLKSVNWENMSKGLFLFSVGLCKKVLIADTLAEWADTGYAVVGSVELGMLTAWTIALSYTFQLYFDFSGYTDMALGVSRMLNIKLPINFDSPYRAGSVIEFWRRWHITLSSFLRDYLYIPLGGNRRGTWRKYGNIMATMLLGGLWHGAGWTFVLWGGIHGAGIVVNHVFRAEKLSMSRWVSVPLTFLFVNFAWVFFRAQDMAQAFSLLKSMCWFHGVQAISMGADLALPDGRREFLAVVGLFFLCQIVPNSIKMSEAFKPKKAWAVAAGILLLLGICCLNKSTTFLYYQF